MSSQHHLLLLLFALIHLSLSQVYFDTVFPCVLRGAIASCAQCDFANPQTAWVGACARCRGNNDDEICVSGCPSNRLLSKCDDDDEPTPSPTPPRPTPRPSPLPTPMPVPTTTQQVIVYTQSPTPPPTPYPTEPSAVPTASTTMYKSTSESTSFVDTTIDGSTTVSIFTIMLSSVPATASSETSAAESPVPFFTDNNAQSTMAPLSLDAWVGIGCAAVILCSCCLTFCVVCAVRRKRRRDAERNDALAYYQNAARPAPPTMSVFNTASVPFATTQPHLQQPQQQTGIVAKRALMVQPPSASQWSSSSLPTVTQANDNFNRFPYSTSTPPGYESPTSALPNPYSSQASRYIDAAAPFQTQMMASAGYEMPPVMQSDF